LESTLQTPGTMYMGVWVITYLKRLPW
jgi:hypothetical protein